MAERLNGNLAMAAQLEVRMQIARDRSNDHQGIAENPVDGLAGDESVSELSPNFRSTPVEPRAKKVETRSGSVTGRGRLKVIGEDKDRARLRAIITEMPDLGYFGGRTRPKR